MSDSIKENQPNKTSEDDQPNKEEEEEEDEPDTRKQAARLFISIISAVLNSYR
jgi:hypothetical protein